MAGRFSQRILDYCQQHEIEVPVGFHRRAASRYVIVLLGERPKLVATTWFASRDVLHYIDSYAGGTPCRILDFKESVELRREGARLVPVGPL